MLAGVPATVSHELTMHQSIPKIRTWLVVPVYVVPFTSMPVLSQGLFSVKNNRGKGACTLFVFSSFFLSLLTQIY